MRTIATVVAVALIVATAAADNACFFNATSKTQVNLNGMADYRGTAAGYTIDVSPCVKVNSTDCAMAYGSVAKGRTVSCFQNAPQRAFDTTTNTTTFVFNTAVNTLAMLMEGSTVRRLRTQYVCDPTATNVTEDGSSYRQVDYQLTIKFKTAAACPFVPTPAPTPAPHVDHHDDDDDGKTVAAAIAVAVVVVVFVGIGGMILYFRKTAGSQDTEGYEAI